MSADHLAVLLVGQAIFVVVTWCLGELALRGRRRLLRLGTLMAMASAMVGLFWVSVGVVAILTPSLPPIGALVVVGGLVVIWTFLGLTWELVSERDGLPS